MMARIGGESYRCRAVVLCASLVIGVSTYLAPSIAFAADDAPATSPQPTESFDSAPTFSVTDTYVVRAADVVLHTSPAVQRVEFFYDGGAAIAGIRDDSASTAADAVWRPVTLPAAATTMTARADDAQVDGQVVLRDALRPQGVQQSNVLSVSAVSGSIAPGDTLHAVFDGKTIDVACPGCETPQLTFQLTGLESGDYDVQFVIYRNGQEYARSTNKVTIIPQAPQPDSSDSELPVVGSDAYVPKLDVVPVSSLSTQFSIPVSSALTAAIAGATTPQSVDAPLATDVKGAATIQTSPLTGLMASPAHAVLDVPVAPTSSGWSVFGLSWYWWLGGAVASWLAVVAVRWWRVS